MDEFELDRPELTGSLISLEFGLGGRIQQIWASDPNQPEPGEEFQFVIPPVAFGEEFTDDYAPGTILIGARLDANDPWILSRNSRARQLDDVDPGVIAYEYDFGLLPEIEATGRFYELHAAIPQICWDLTLANRGRHPIEIGELAFPLALNNLYDGAPRTDRGVQELWDDRVYIHKFIGGAASYVFAQRLNAEPPGLLIVPGEDTNWEFYHHVIASLNTPYRWEGIPVVYVHSKAAIEREEWSTWFNDHSSLTLSPGESRRYQMRFMPADRDRVDNMHMTLQACGRPVMKLFPGAVAPVGVGISVEIQGTTPTTFSTDVDTELDTDSDAEGGFCHVKPESAGAVRLSFEDTQGRQSHAHLLFTEAIATLIQRRASWILENQLHKAPGSNLHNAFLATDVQSGRKLTDPADYGSGFGILSSLSDALFLAEKNTIYPKVKEIEALDRYIRDFLDDDVRNPANGVVGSSFGDDRSVSHNTARPAAYSLTSQLLLAMCRIANVYGGTAKPAKVYLLEAARTAEAMFVNGFGRGQRWAGVPGLPRFASLIEEMGLVQDEELRAIEQRLVVGMMSRARDLNGRQMPYGVECLWSAEGFSEAYWAARWELDERAQERTMRAAFAARSLAPSWWWYGSDKRFLDDLDAPHPAMFDKGEMCLGPTTSANSALFLNEMDRDYPYLPEPMMRLAFGGLLAVWALVRSDGAAAMGFCPDQASRQYGMSWMTGDVGLGLWSYLVNVSAVVLPSAPSGVATFGCEFGIEEVGGEDRFVVKPWDGVGRRIIVRQLGLEVEASGAQIESFRFDSRKRFALVEVRNPADRKAQAAVRISGLWGNQFDVNGQRMTGIDGRLSVGFDIPGRDVRILEIRVRER